ncbi:sulfotransferase [Sporosalibacterium faouarense]|uniref:sulfotransferase n=1 Tax=Sporosalibacterium faouarense TaxID=516123 RepID=UPI00141D082A|nr:sulfotransferase [Sporosalibacterium faouarense]MTI48985.1 sulfotransferase [Bacillota bacterium]
MELVISAICQRTGSTLLQRIFNKRDKTLIWGEHGGALTHFIRGYQVAKYFSNYSTKIREEYLSNRKDGKWIANMAPDEKLAKEGLVNSTRVFLDSYYRQLEDEYDIIGFKEVRYGRDEINLLLECYPDINIILLVRNPIDIWKSIPKKKDGSAQDPWINLENLIQQWNSYSFHYINLSKHNLGVHLFKYEDIISRDRETLRQICEIGQLNVDQIEEVLLKKTYSTRQAISEEDKNKILEGCRNRMKSFKYI